MKTKVNGFQIKVIGVITMVFDHLGQFFSFLGIPLWFHWIGRIAAPLFLFESSEGFIHTSNRKKYMFRLLIGFWIMSVGDWILNTYFAIGNAIVINNIFGTLLVGTIYMQSIEFLKSGVKNKSNKDILSGIGLFLLPILTSVFPFLGIFTGGDSTIVNWIVILSGFFLPSLLLAEGGILFVLLAVLFYLFHGKKIWQVLSLVVIAAISYFAGGGNPFTDNYQWMMLLSAIPIILYDGTKGKSMRNFFYIFYPAHIYIFALISYFIQR